MRCPSCHAKCSSKAAVCGSCGAALPQSSTAGMRPVSRLAYQICRSGRETLAVLCLSLLIFTGAAVTLSCAASVYEPLTAAAGLEAFSLRTADDSKPLTDQETELLKEKSAQARAQAARYGAGAVLGLLLFSGSLLVLVRVSFVANRLRTAEVDALPTESALQADNTAEDAAGNDPPVQTAPESDDPDLNQNPSKG